MMKLVIEVEVDPLGADIAQLSGPSVLMLNSDNLLRALRTVAIRVGGRRLDEPSEGRGTADFGRVFFEGDSIGHWELTNG